MTTDELIAKYGRAQLGVDGNAAYALLGGDIQEGEAEFVELPPKWTVNDELVCAKKALFRLRERLGRPDLSYYFGRSHPYGN